MSQNHDILEGLSAYLDGELTAVEARRFEVAIYSDAALAEPLRRLRALRDLLRGLPRICAPAGFAERVLAEARRRGLFDSLRAEAMRAQAWLSRVLTAAAVLLAVGLGAALLPTIWPHKHAPSATPTSDGSLPGLVPSGESASRGAAGAVARKSSGPLALTWLGEELAHGGSSAASQPRQGVNDFAWFEKSARAHGVGLGQVTNGEATAGLSRYGAKLDQAAVRHVELCVTDLSAGRDEVVAVLAAAGLRRPSVSVGHRKALPGGPATAPTSSPGPPEGGLKAGRQLKSEAEARQWQIALAGPRDELARIAASLPAIKAAAKDRDPSERLCAAGGAVTTPRPKGLPPMPSRPKPAPKPAATEPYHVAPLKRLGSREPNATTQIDSTGPAHSGSQRQGGSPERREVLVITLRMDAAAATTQSATQLDMRQEPATRSTEK